MTLENAIDQVASPEDDDVADVTELARVLRVGEPFSDVDKGIIRAVAGMLPGLGMMFGKQCEILLQSLETPENSVLAAINTTISEREVGAPLTPRGIRFITKLTTIWRKEGAVCYLGTGPHGEQVKSVIIPVYNDEGRCLGVISAAFNLDAPLHAWFEEMFRFSCTFQQVNKSAISYGGSENLFIQRIIANTLRDVEKQKNIRQRDKIKNVIQLLHKKGVFDRKDAINIVSTQLNITPATVYHHIREMKQRKNPGN